MKYIALVGFYLAVMATALRARAKTFRSHTREVGASTIEWAIIAAVSVIMATLIGGVIYKVVTDKKDAINKCNTTAPAANATC